MPDGLRWDIAADVLTPHQRNMIAKLRHGHIDESATVTVLLRRHLVEHLGAWGVIVVQAIGKIGKNARPPPRC
jgi:hypothetical protein